MRGLALLATPPSAPRACVPLSLESGSWQEWSLQDVGLFDAAIFAAAGAGIWALTARGGTTSAAGLVRAILELDGVALPFLSPRRQQLRFSVLSKMIVDTIDGAQRLAAAAYSGRRRGAGGAAAARALPPVGCDFDRAHSRSPRRGVEPRLARLDDVATTPGEIISYEGEKRSSTRGLGVVDELMACSRPPTLRVVRRPPRHRRGRRRRRSTPR